MAIPDIRFVIGNDPAFLKQGPSVVSGFEEWRQEEVEKLCKLAADECRRVFEWAPPELQQQFGNELIVPLYNNKEDMRGAGCRFGDMGFSFMGKRTERGIISAPLARHKPIFKGMYVVHPEGKTETVDDMRLMIGHECLHILSKDAVHAYYASQSESLIARVEKERYGERSRATLDRQWDPSGFESTSGLSGTSFGIIIDSPKGALKETLYPSSYFAADALSEKQIWEIWRTLTAHSKEKNLMPTIPEIDAVIKNVGGTAGEETLMKSPFTAMTPGTHHYKFVRKNGAVRVNTLKVNQNLNYGYLNANNFDDTLFTIQGVRSGPYKVSLYDEKGNESLYSGKAEFDSVQDLDFEFVMSMFSRSKNFDEIHKCKRVEIQVPGLSPIVLHPKTETPAHTAPVIQNAPKPPSADEIADIAMQKAVSGQPLSPTENDALQGKYGFRVD